MSCKQWQKNLKDESVLWPPTKKSLQLWGWGGGSWPANNQSSSGQVVLVAFRAGLLHLHHHSLYGDLFLAVAAVQLVVFVVRGLLVVLGARRSWHGAEGVGAGGGQWAQQRGALRYLLVLFRAALPLLWIGVRVTMRGDHFLLAHWTRLLSFGQPGVHTLTVVGYRQRHNKQKRLIIFWFSRNLTTCLSVKRPHVIFLYLKGKSGHILFYFQQIQWEDQNNQFIWLPNIACVAKAWRSLFLCTTWALLFILSGS